MLAMRRAETLRDKAVQTFAQSLLRRAAEHLLSRRIEKHDALVLINSHDRVHRRSQNAGELGLAQSQRRGDPRLVLIICARRFLSLHNFSRNCPFSVFAGQSIAKRPARILASQAFHLSRIFVAPHHSSPMPVTSSTCRQTRRLSRSASIFLPGSEWM